MIMCAALALFVPACAYAHSYPCSFSVIADSWPASYGGHLRANPDGTYYEGDAFGYSASYPGLGSCLSPRAYPPEASAGLSLGRSAVGDAQPAGPCRGARCSAGHAEISAAGPVPRSESVSFSAGGWKVACDHYADGEQCRYTWVYRTAAVHAAIADPALKLRLERAWPYDEDGYNATNSDGTYYVWDPIAVRSEPSYRWQDERTATLSIEFGKKTRLYEEKSVLCGKLACAGPLVHAGLLPMPYELGYGGDITIYNATGADLLGNRSIWHEARLLNIGRPIAAESETDYALVAAYAPEYEAYPYLVLSDMMPASWDNRHAVAMNYLGSRGAGPDDDPRLHEGRRSKINYFEHGLAAYRAGVPFALGQRMSWDQAYGPEPGLPGNCTGVQHDAESFGAAANGTAVFFGAGYGRIMFELPIAELMQRRLYSDATINATMYSAGFAGHETKGLFSYNYRYPDAVFGNRISTSAYDSRGPAHGVPVSISAAPNLAMPGVQATHDYVCDKAERDTGQRGLGDVLVRDMYPRTAYAEGAGNASLYVPRISTWDAPYIGGILEVAMDEGFDAPAPYAIYLGAGQKTLGLFHSYGHSYDHSYVANLDLQNRLNISGFKAAITASVGPEFGPIERVVIGGIEHAPAANCAGNCILPTPEGPVLIEAYNSWGGRAHAHYEPPPRQLDGPGAGLPYTAAAVLAASFGIWQLALRLGRQR